MVPRRGPYRFEIVVLAADADALLTRGGAFVTALLAAECNRSLNCTMPALANMSVGIVLRNDRAALPQISWPFLRAKKLRNADREARRKCCDLTPWLGWEV